jgi:hypothetical protein
MPKRYSSRAPDVEVDDLDDGRFDRNQRKRPNELDGVIASGKLAPSQLFQDGLACDEFEASFRFRPPLARPFAAGNDLGGGSRVEKKAWDRRLDVDALAHE